MRKAFEELLPPEIVWRDKEQFAEGSGTADLLPALLANALPAAEAHAYQQQYPHTRLRGLVHKALTPRIVSTNECGDRVADQHVYHGHCTGGT